MRIVLLGYLLVGLVYMVVNAIRNWIASEYYRNESFTFYLLSMAGDVLLWPVILFCDMYGDE